MQQYRSVRGENNSTAWGGWEEIHRGKGGTESQRHKKGDDTHTHTHKGGRWSKHRKHAAPRLALARKQGGKTSGRMRGRQAAKDYRLRQPRKTRESTGVEGGGTQNTKVVTKNLTICSWEGIRGGGQGIRRLQMGGSGRKQVGLGIDIAMAQGPTPLP